AVHGVADMLRRITADQPLATASRLCHPGERFHDYLAEEVIGAASEQTRDLLRRLAYVGDVGAMTELEQGPTTPTFSMTGLVELCRQGLVWRGGVPSMWSLAPVLRDYFEHTAQLGAHERTMLPRRAADARR